MAEKQPASRPRRYIVLAALLLLYVSNQWARMLPSFLVAFDEAGRAGRTGRELMNLGLGFNAAQYGLLVSYGFTMASLWSSYGFHIVLKQFSYGFPKGFPTFFDCFPIAFL